MLCHVLWAPNVERFSPMPCGPQKVLSPWFLKVTILLLYLLHLAIVMSWQVCQSRQGVQQGAVPGWYVCQVLLRAVTCSNPIAVEAYVC
jgi:hypothetical protein